MNQKNIGSLDKLLSEITPEEQEKTDAKMKLATKIADAMEAKGWNNKKLMEAMGKKNPSEITRWLSGTHNFTMETLIDLGRVLQTKFINLEEKEQNVRHFNLSVVAYASRPIPAASVNESQQAYTYFNQIIYS